MKSWRVALALVLHPFDDMEKQNYWVDTNKQRYWFETAREAREFFDAILRDGHEYVRDTNAPI